MAIRFVAGSAGSGKSVWLRKYCAALALEHPEMNIFYFVPDQFTLSTQRELCEEAASRVTLNIEALSFERFARRVFNELSIGLPGILDDTGKALLLSKIVNDRKEDLTLLSSAAGRPGVIDELKSFLSEMRQYNVSVDDLAAAVSENSVSPALKTKAKDLITIYSDFVAQTEGKYITAEEIMDILLSCIDRSEMVKRAAFVFDGFTGFTPVQYEVIDRLMTLSKDLTFSFTIGDEEDLFGEPREEDLFYLTKKSVKRLTALAEKNGVDIQAPVRLTAEAPARFPAESPLGHLSASVFRPEKAAYAEAAEAGAGRKGGEPAEDEKASGAGRVTLVSAHGPREELSIVASKIITLVREKDYRFRDFAVLCADQADYAFLAPEIFAAYRIPVFIDSRTDLVYNPLLEAIDAALAVARFRYSYEDVVRFMRTGLGGISREETDLFDSYAASSGVKGVGAYRKIFSVLPENMTVEDLTAVNAIRERFMAYMDPFVTAVRKKGTTITDCLTALYGLLSDIGAEEALRERAKAFEEAGDEIMATQYAGVFGQVVDAMDQMAALCGDRETDVTAFSQTLSIGLSELSTGVLPGSNDCVVVGDLTRTRLDHIRVLFLVGAHDGAIPRSADKGGILSETERETLLSLSLELAPSAREKAFIQQYYLYLALTRPSDALYIIYGKHGGGNPVRPSYLISEIRAIFGGCDVEEKLDPLPDDVLLAAKKGGRELLSRALSAYADGLLPEEKEEELFSLYAAFKEEKDGRELLSAAFFSRREEEISAETLQEKHGSVIEGTISNMERYSACPYAYFLRYELSLQEKREAALTPSDIGNLYHDVLKVYSLKLKEKGLNFKTVSDELSLAVLNDSLQTAVERMRKAAFLASAAEEHVIANVRRTVAATIWAIRRQAARGAYVPTRFEQPVGKDGPFDDYDWSLPGGMMLKFKGQIDRLDTFTTTAGDRTFVRIIDYKSGGKKVDFSRLYYGTDLQLPTYMGAALHLVRRMEPGKLVLPGGFFYSHITDPIIEGGPEMGEQKLQDQRLLSYRLAGVVNDDRENLTAMDEIIFDEERAGEDSFGHKSPVVDLELKKDGGLKAPTAEGSRIATADMTALVDFARKKEKEIGGKIAAGSYPVSPLEEPVSGSDGKKRTSCTFCPYGNVCGFDRRLPGYELRRMEKKSLQDIIGEVSNG